MAYIYVEPKEKTYAKVYRVARRTNASSFSINIRTTYPSVDYTKLSNSDFVCSYISDATDHYGEAHGYWGNDTFYSGVYSFSVSHSYNASTGVLTVTPSTPYSFYYKDPNGTGDIGLSNLVYDVYMIVDGVRSQYV